MQINNEAECKLWVYTALMQAFRFDSTRNERQAPVPYATSTCCGFVALPLSALHYIMITILINMAQVGGISVSVATRKLEQMGSQREFSWVGDGRVKNA